MCTGAILRAKINASTRRTPSSRCRGAIRNPYGIRFSPNDHPLKGGLMVSENGEDERGARPTNNAPDRLAHRPPEPGRQARLSRLAGPLRLPRLDAGGVQPERRPGATTIRRSSSGKPVLPVLAFSAAAAHGAARRSSRPTSRRSASTSRPTRSSRGIVKKGAALVSREGDFGFSQANGTPEAGHDVELVNFSSTAAAASCELSRSRSTAAQADQRHDPGRHAARATARPSRRSLRRSRGINRPTTIRFGPDGAAYLVDYGAVRDSGQLRSGLAASTIQPTRRWCRFPAPA